jgi:HAE1 family hydrophobic/amphiphilic exporter-1
MFEKILHVPIFAIVLSVMIVMMGLLSIAFLPIAQFPSIVPPRVSVSVTFPGASAQVMTKSVLIPLGNVLNGVKNMRYMVSQAASSGEATFEIYFEPGTDPGLAVVYVQNRVQKIKKRLPLLVQREGIFVTQAKPSMLMYINIFSKNKDADQQFLYNFAYVNVLPVLWRVHGIGQAKILGTRKYAMRIWLKPDRMRAYHISTEEVMKALEGQSFVMPLGRLGRASGKVSQTKEYVLTYEGRYNDVEEYQNIVVRTTSEGETLLLSEVADVELGSEFYDIYSSINGYPSATITLKQTPGSNAKAVIEEVKARLEEIKAESFPPGTEYDVSYDVATFVNASIRDVLHTLLEAFVLVALVVFLFLGDWRSTLIPTLTVPISLIGTFFLMMMFGLSINLITLFAMVLAIGLVVDDAIVVVEAVHAAMHDKHLSPYRATRDVLRNLSGAIIAISLVMVSVFIPVTFMTGPVGVFYRQFAITMVSAILLSAVTALTLTPVLCAMILKPVTGQKKGRGPLAWVLRLFDQTIEKGTSGYAWTLHWLVPRRALTLLVIGGFCVGIYVVNLGLPSGFIPTEDQGIIYAVLQTPPGSTLEYTNAKAMELQKIARSINGVTSVSSLSGFEMMSEGRGSNAGSCIINLVDWSQRDRNAGQILEDLQEACSQRIAGVKLEFFEPPAVPGYSAVSGLSFRLLDETNSDQPENFAALEAKFLQALSHRRELAGVFTFFSNDYPQYQIVVDNETARQKGISVRDALQDLAIRIGSTYEQGFIRFGKFYKVYVQAAPEYRRTPQDLDSMFTMNKNGEMVPYSAFMKLVKQQGRNEIVRYNLYPSAAIRCRPGSGYSSGQAIAAIRDVAAETLPRGYNIGWEGMTYAEAGKGNLALYIFLVVVAFVYLVLAAQYESLTLPLAVIASLPIGVFGSFLCLRLMGLSNNVYAQIGLIMLVGLLGKNAILVIEFAVQRRREGMELVQSAIEGGRVRLRPILMTSFAMIVGLFPLVIATGPTAKGGCAIGTCAAGGMFAGTVIGVWLIPGLYYLFGRIDDGKKLIHDDEDEQQAEP